MAVSKRFRVLVRILGGFVLFVALVLGGFVGVSIASMENLGRLQSYTDYTSALPTQVFDIKGRLITEFFADEKRELVKIEDLPPHLIYALVTREDQDFFKHNGFSMRGIFRAVWGIVSGQYTSGGSTITQQLATSIYLDKDEFSITRKIREIWYAVQIERNWSKNEILEEYLNRMPFGHNTHGVEAASQFFFGHPAKELTVAESVMLILQVSSPSRGTYSPFKNPNVARERQHEILGQMVDLGYVSKAEADKSFNDYWANYDYTRTASDTAYFDRVSQDRAPYFSEYVRYQLENQYLLGSSDINRDGYKVYTTLNLDYQQAADKLMADGIAKANKTYRDNVSGKSNVGEETFVPVIDLLSLSFNMPKMRVGGQKQLNRADAEYRDDLNPIFDLMSIQFGYEGKRTVRDAVAASYVNSRTAAQRNTVEGALIALDNSSGYIVAMIGGSGFEGGNQVNRAMDGKIQPGSTFKPLYYAAGIERGIITPATMINDTQVVFENDDGTPYKPLNYKGEWKGPVLVRTALANSMNVPSLRILNRIGFDDAIGVSSRLLGIPQEELLSRGFVRKYPLGLGVVTVAPVEMAKAFSVFPNQGRDLSPISIRYIEDRSGKIISEPEKEIQEELRRRGSSIQLISPQTAYIMTDLLQSVIQNGTLSSAASLVGGFSMPMAGKTGTTQNWADIWTVGFSPYYTAAVWLGFDKGGGNSLGTNQTGATAVGPIWAKFMKSIHEGLPVKRFARPDTGISYVPVTLRSGLLPPPDYKGDVRTEIFKAGTEPTAFDEMQAREDEITTGIIDRMGPHILFGMPVIDATTVNGLDTTLNFDDSLLNSANGNSLQPAPSTLPGNRSGSNQGNTGSSNNGSNSLLD